MNRPQRHSLRWLARHRKRGQSIPIIALMIVVLIAMVGLSVDVGNTFSHEREAVSASNAASIAGMTAYIGRTAGATDQSIYDSITKSLRSNGITTGDGSSGTLQVNAYYLDSEGQRLANHPVVGSGGEAPSGVSFIQVSVAGKVDTSFARVVGRPDLPVNATAYAASCPPNAGVYPLAVSNEVITNNVFNKTGTTGNNPEYFTRSDGYIQRRVWMKSDTSGGFFSWLRWKEVTGANGTRATSSQELVASMTGQGNLAWGFDEAPWPGGVAQPTGGYKTNHMLSAGDWAWGSPGWQNSVDMRAALDQHTLKTYMILPIYDQVIGNGENVQVHVQSLGKFMIVNRDMTGNGGKGPYIDMIYFGPADNAGTACSMTPSSPDHPNTLQLSGSVSFYPEFQIIPTQQKPIQYVVVLDASGSMSANFNGQCDENGLVQCANGPAGYPAVQVTNTGPDHYWSNQNERRIYVAKKALTRLVQLTNMSGNAGFATTRPPDQMAVVWFNESVPSGNVKSFSSNPTSISNFIKTLNNGYGNYRSQGGTNGAGGLYRASLLYNAAPKTVSFNGQNVEYKRVVLFITDGVSNQFLDTNADNLLGGQSSASTYARDSYCRNLGNLVVESSSCQTTQVGSTYNGWDRPITQMINTSQTYLRNTTTNAEVFVIALSNIPTTGLRDGVPSSTNYFFPAENLTTSADGTTNVDGIIDQINAKVETGSCQAGANGATSGAIASGEFVNGTGGFQYPQVGKVIIKSQTDTLTAPIIAGTDGKLSYIFPDVPQGIYRMEAYLYYHHPSDPAGVMRMYSRIWSDGQAISDFTVDVSPSSQNVGMVQKIDQPLTLKLDGNVCP